MPCILDYPGKLCFLQLPKGYKQNMSEDSAVTGVHLNSAPERLITDMQRAEGA